MAGRLLGRALPAVPGRVVVVPPAASGSLGDGALLDVLVAEVGPGHDLRVAAVTRLGHQDPAGSGRVAGPSLTRALRLFPPRGWVTLLRARPAAVLVVGADVLNGHYSDWRSARRWDLLAVAAGAGRGAVAVGFSWPEPDGVGPGAGAAARRATAVAASTRDPVSARRFATATGRAPAVGADVAFLLAPDPTTPAVAEVVAWAAACREVGRRPVAVNLNGLLLGRPDEQPDRVAAVAAAVAALADEGVDVVLLPHDRRAGAADRAWSDAVQAAVDGRAPATLVATPERAGEAKAMVDAVDVVVTGRMHLAIGALGTGTPVSLHDYQGKVEGLAALFPGADLRAALPADRWCAELDVTVRDLLADAPRRAAAIAAALPAVVEQARMVVDHAVAAVDGAGEGPGDGAVGGAEVRRRNRPGRR